MLIRYSLNLYQANFNRNEFSTTLTLDSAINPLAHVGVIWKLMPKR